MLVTLMFEWSPSSSEESVSIGIRESKSYSFSGCSLVIYRQFKRMPGDAVACFVDCVEIYHRVII
jgi:hypothetical protein